MKSDENNGETIADLAEIYGNFGTALVRTGNFDEGLLNQEKSLEFFKRAVEKSPENIELKRGFAKITALTVLTRSQMAKLQSAEKTKIFK